MPKRTSRTGSELFIVDNSDVDWKVLRYLHDWCQISEAIDIASGYFEIGALLGLQGEWQKVDRIRILMGDEVSQRTRAAFAEGLARVRGRLDKSLEDEKQTNDFLAGVPALVEAIRSGKIACRVYRKAKFHAKAYITHARLEVVGSSGLVGSSNFTYPGLTENIELNVQITGRTIDPFAENRQKQVVGLIRTQFLKRFESSANAFACSCDRLLVKLLAFASRHSETQAEKSRLERWLLRHKDLIGYVHERQLELFGSEDDDEAEEDLVSEEMLEGVKYLEREQYHIEQMLNETYEDLDQIIEFRHELRKLDPKKDDKLKALTRLLIQAPVGCVRIPV